MHDDKFNSDLIAMEQVHIFEESACRFRKLIGVYCKDLLSDCQKYHFSANGQYVAVATKDGCRISILELIQDRKRRLHQLVLLCICYRGFWSQKIKSIAFSPDN